MSCYIWHSEEGYGRAEAPPSPLLDVPDVNAHPSTASVRTNFIIYYLMWHYNCLWTLGLTMMPAVLNRRSRCTLVAVMGTAHPHYINTNPHVIHVA